MLIILSRIQTLEQDGTFTKIVIVRGVAGGASCAARLRRLNGKAEILMLERRPNVSYANCGLPYHVGGEIEKGSSLLVATEATFRAQSAIDVRTRCDAGSGSTNLRTKGRLNVTTQQRAIRCTKLILIASALWLGVLGGGQAVAGGRGNLVGSYPDTGIFFLAANFNWVF